MTIKDVEFLTGLPRANIRFYESEGLIDPARSDNGHRDYSEDDVQSLQKIKLLRSLQVSIEEIRALQSGACDLKNVLQEKSIELEQQREQLHTASELCRRICDEGQSYAVLDAEKYLSNMEDTPLQIQGDHLPRVRKPIRRYLARSFDLLLCTLLLNLPLVMLTRINLNNLPLFWEVMHTFAVLSVMLAMEGFLLAKLGTTPGKWLMGLSVTDDRGDKLSLSDAYNRSWLVIFHGMGYGIPVWSMINLIKSYRKCDAGEELAWEADTRLHAKKPKIYSRILFVLCYAALAFALWITFGFGAVPPHRGDISAEQFYENYNQLADYYDVLTYKKTDDGNWYAEDGTEILLVDDYVQIDCVEENGILQSVTISADDWFWLYENETFLCLQAFIAAEHPKYAFTDEIARRWGQMSDTSNEFNLAFDDFWVEYNQEFEHFTVTITKF